MNRRSNIYRAHINRLHVSSRRAARLRTQSRSAVRRRRRHRPGIAHAYSVFATGGRELGLRQETLDLLAAPAIPPTRGFYDECMKGEACSSHLGS